MRERPRELRLLALVLVGIAISIPVQVMFLFGDTPNNPGLIFVKLTPMNLLVMFLAIIHAVMVFTASRGTLISAPAFIAAVVWNNWLVAAAGLNFSAVMATGASLGVVGFHSLLLTKKAWKVIQDPKLRWWRTEPRRIITVRAVINPAQGGEVSSNTFDLSSSGAFFPIVDSDGVVVAARTLKNLRVGSRCSIMLMLDQLHLVKCFAEVVRNTNARGNYPGGFGVRFTSMDSGQKKILADFLSAKPTPPANPVLRATV